MSKTSIRSRRASIRRPAGKKKLLEKPTMKPFGFCCSLDDNDPLTTYNQRLPPAKTSLDALCVHECPTLRIFTREIGKRRTNLRLFRDNMMNSSNVDILNVGNQRKGPGTAWFLEDETKLMNAMTQMVMEKKYNHMMDKAVASGEAKDEQRYREYKPPDCPYWYQDFSFMQLAVVNNLQRAIDADIEEEGIKQTANKLAQLGVTSTYFTIEPKTLKRLIRTCNNNPVILLYDVYKLLTGHFIDEENDKIKYNCNERIIVSAMAFLLLPQAILELNKRLPPFVPPPKPQKPVFPTSHKLGVKRDSPYLTAVDIGPNWKIYTNKMMKWLEDMEAFPIPKLILPDEPLGVPLNISDIRKKPATEPKDDSEAKKKASKPIEKPVEVPPKPICPRDSQESLEEIIEMTPSGHENIIVPSGDMQRRNRFGAKSKKKPKSWLGEKDSHYVISGTVGSNDDPCRILYSFDSIAKISPVNSDEEFFAKLNYQKTDKTFPRGRENLSLKWQDWLINVEQEFLKAGNQAENLLNDLAEMTKSFRFPDPACDPCCSCRQTRRSNLKFHVTKTPRTVIDAVVSDIKGPKSVVGALMMHSPPPSPEGSITDIIRVIPSKHEISKKIIVNGVTDPDGNTVRDVTGVVKIENYTPSQIETIVPDGRGLREVPSCKCAVEKIFNEGVTPSPSDVEVIWTNEKNVCFGKKYRPDAGPAYSCCQYPTDETCKAQRNLKKILEDYLKRMRGECEKQRVEYDPLSRGPFPKYTTPIFKTAGDGDGTVPTDGSSKPDPNLSPEEQAKRDKEMQQSLEVSRSSDSSRKGISNKAQSPDIKVRNESMKSGDTNEDRKNSRVDSSDSKKTARTYRICMVSEQDDNAVKQSVSKTPSKTDQSKNKSPKANTGVKGLRSQLSFVKEKSELNDHKFVNTKELAKLMKTELRNMADEGILFAMFPDIFKMPQLQYWIFYRGTGIPYYLTDIYKKKSMKSAKHSWEIMERLQPKFVRPLKIATVVRDMPNVTYDHKLKLMRKIARVKSRFFTKIRQGRVENSRMMWATMDFAKLPDFSFKRAYFTYFPGKEMDGHVTHCYKNIYCK